MTIRELAALAGVSTSTVSKIMNHKDDSISAATREHVLEIAKQYRYQPYAAATGNARSLVLGVIFRDATSINMTMTGILHEAQDAGYSLVIRESRFDPEVEAQNIAVMLSCHVDGLIWEFVGEESARLLPQLEEAETPVVLFHSQHPDAVNIDYSQFGYAATQALIDLGHTNIACVLTPLSVTLGFQAGYERCLFENHIPFNPAMMLDRDDPLLREKISEHAMSGLVVSRYETAAYLYEMAHEMHYDIPYDLSILSLRDDASSRPASAAISTYTIPHFEYGVYLCKRLIHDIEQSDEPMGEFVCPIVQTYRGSTGAPHDYQLPKIVVVGSINIDNYLKVDTLPAAGQTVSSSASSVHVGGKGTNQAIGAARLGRRVSIIGCVGQDADSDTVFQLLRSYQIDYACVRRVPEQRTGQAYIFVQRDGESMISVMAGANDDLTVQDVQAADHAFRNCAYCLVQTEIPMDIVRESCRIAHQHRAQTIVKPAACGPLSDEVLAGIDILIPNRGELNNICPISGSIEDKAAWLVEKGVPVVIVTLDADGCYLRTATESRYYSAIDFDAVDTTGAGDAFIAALASYLMEGYSLDAAIRIANYAAGFSISREGTSTALIDNNSLESYIRQVEPELLLTAAE